MAPIPSPATSTAAGGGSDKEREAAIEAKIARIRANNEALMKRHREVEADRQSAEDRDSALRQREGRADASRWEQEGAFRNPYQGDSSRTQRPQLRRPGADSGGGAGTGSSRGGTSAPPPVSVKQRLGEREAPPPDPNYRFLADDARDGGGDRFRGRRGGAVSARGGRGAGRGRGEATRAAGGPQARLEDQRREYTRRNNENFENVSPTNRRGSGGDWQVKESSPGGGATRGRGRGGGRGGAGATGGRSSVQDRLLRARTQNNEDNRRITDAGGKNLRVEVNFSRSPPAVSSPQTTQHTSNSPHSSPAHHQAKQASPKKEEPSQQPLPDDDEWADEASNWQEVPTQQQPQPAYEDWRTAPTTVLDWSEEVANEIPVTPEIIAQQNQWNYQYDATASVPAAPPQMVPVSPYYEPQPAFVPYAAAASTTYHPQQTTAAPALTQVAHGPHHNMPIMTSQPLMHGMPHQHQQHQQHHDQQYYHHYQQTSYDSGGQHHGGRGGGGGGDYYTPPRRAAYDSSSHFYEGGRGRGRGASRWADREPPTKEVTKIPSRFQKQRMPKATATRSGPTLPSDLPKAVSDEAPSSCRRLTLMAASDDAETGTLLGKSLGVSVRHVTVSDTSGLFDKVSEVSPDLDRFVVIHTGATEALEIAGMSGSSDVEKGAESDRVADSIADLAEDLVRRIPYCKVFVSMLCPRFDDAGGAAAAKPAVAGIAGGGMTVPNSVRRVINVQLSMRLRGKESEGICVLNNDEPLADCFEDDVKREAFFGGGDGVSLTEEGRTRLVEHWADKMRPEVKVVETARDADKEEGAASELAKKVEEVAIDKKKEGDEEEDDEEVFHEARNEVDKSAAAAESSSLSSSSDFREKENDEQMEKELKKSGGEEGEP